MRITGPDILSGDKIPVPRHAGTDTDLPLYTDKQSPGVKHTGKLLTKHLTRIFVNRGIDIPPSQIHALEAELSALGLTATEIDDTSILNALLLKRHSIPLTRELLDTLQRNESTIFKGVSLLREDALSLLGNIHFYGKNRNALEVLVTDINAFFKGIVSPDSMKYAMEDIINLWAYDLESKLLSLAEGQAESAAEITGGDFNEVEIALKSIFNPLSEDDVNQKAEALIKVLRNAVSEIHSQIQEIDFRHYGASELLKEAIETFRYHLSVIAGEYESLIAPGSESGLSSVLLGELLGENTRILENRLLAQLLFNASGGDFTEITDGALNTLQLKNIIQNSGMAFEWQLLAWYRSGMDTGRLHALLHEDLKGILMSFSNRLKKNQAKGKIKKKLELLEKNSQTQLKNITNRQLSNILNKLGVKRGFYLELPLGTEQGQRHTRISVKGSKDSEKEKNLNSQKFPFSLEIEIEMSKIGMVNVFMTFSGKTVSLSFELESEKISSTVTDMGQELREKLMKKGFVVGSVEFRKRDSNLESNKAGSKPAEKVKSSKNLDIIG